MTKGKRTDNPKDQEMEGSRDEATLTIIFLFMRGRGGKGLCGRGGMGLVERGERGLD